MPNNGRINWLCKLYVGHTCDGHIYFLEAANGRTVDRCFSQDWLVIAGILFKIVVGRFVLHSVGKNFPGWH
jgi:hypothetical protein